MPISTIITWPVQDAEVGQEADDTDKENIDNPGSPR